MGQQPFYGGIYGGYQHPFYGGYYGGHPYGYGGGAGVVYTTNITSFPYGGYQQPYYGGYQQPFYVYNSLTMVASMVATVVSTEEFNSHSMVDIMVDTMDLNTMADKYMGEN